MSKPGSTDALIIGGGIVGCACALELAQRGMRVAVIDKGQIGHGCSYGNAGMLTPCHAFPLPMPGVLRQALKWILDPDSPLRIAPKLDWRLAAWLGRFALATNRRQALRSLRSLVELSLFSLDAYKRWDSEDPGAFAFSQRGLVVAARSSAGMAMTREEVELVAPLGVRGWMLEAEPLRELEPAITSRGVIGGAFFPDEATVEPLETVRYLAGRCEQLGVSFLPCVEVFEFKRRDGALVAAETTRGPLRADHFVLAAGAWSGRIASSLGLRVPMLSGKGYAVTVDLLAPMPTHPILLQEARVAATPRRDSVRLAGTLELVGLDESITPRRVGAILRGARRYVNLPEEPHIREIWRGLRPCLPDGMPIIGRAPRLKNLFLATGHQMLGLQTAPASGRLLADLVLGDPPCLDPEPFRATRF